MGIFINDAGNNGADVFLLVADKLESQNEGFDLRNWYEGYGYEQVFDEEDTTLMVWDLSLYLPYVHSSELLLKF